MTRGIGCPAPVRMRPRNAETAYRIESQPLLLSKRGTYDVLSVNGISLPAVNILISAAVRTFIDCCVQFSPKRL